MHNHITKKIKKNNKKNSKKNNEKIMKIFTKFSYTLKHTYCTVCFARTYTYTRQMTYGI